MRMDESMSRTCFNCLPMLTCKEQATPVLKQQMDGRVPC